MTNEIAFALAKDALLLDEKNVAISNVLPAFSCKSVPIPANTLFLNTKVLAAALLSEALPSICKPVGQSVKTELKMEIEEFLRMRIALRNLASMLLAVLPRYGPMSVTFENIAFVCGNTVVPPALLSDSKPSEVLHVHWSAMLGSRTPNKN